MFVVVYDYLTGLNAGTVLSFHEYYDQLFYIMLQIIQGLVREFLPIPYFTLRFLRCT